VTVWTWPKKNKFTSTTRNDSDMADVRSSPD
jgi:hypothetical protein